MVEIDVVGRHALLFDDDATAAFVNSNDALVDWNSLLIDRYDVRHLLSTPPPSRRRRNQQKPHSSPPSISAIDAELDYERYLDLPSPSDEQEADDSAKPVASGGYGAVPFSYGNTEDPDDQKNSDSGLECPGFQPPFPVPDSLIHNIPPTEKLHQIIARTALFVSKHGGQSEIVLRVKQGDNPTFGFLMPDHHLHPYFRFLVDNEELLQSKDEGKPENEGNMSNTDHGAGAGALSLLGSLYGTGEDEDGTAENAPSSKENISEKTVDDSATVTLASDKTGSLVNLDVKDEAGSKPTLLSKEKISVLRRNSFTSLIKAGSSVGMSKGDFSGSVSTAPEKSRASSLPPIPEKSRASSLPPIPKSGHMLLEPPSDLKRLVDKIIEFIMKNGKQFEAVLLEQDREHGRFPFLMPSNQYHPYYLKVLQKAQESKSSAKSSLSEKGMSDKIVSASKKSDSQSFDSTECDIPYDADRKEKFKMIIGKSKKDGPDPPPKDTKQVGVSVDAAQVAAILQAATRGIKNPDLGSLNGNNYVTRGDGGLSSLGSLHSSQLENASLSEVKETSKTAAIESDSSEAHLTREQKLKAERLKRAKMFTAMLKSGDAPSKTEPSRGLSAEPRESEASDLGAKVNIMVKEREGSSAPLDVDNSEKTGKPEKNHFDDVYNERKPGRKYRSRSGRHEEDEAEDEEDDNDGVEDGEKRVHKHKRKKPRRSSVEDDKGEQSEDETSYPDRRKKRQPYHSSPEDDNDEERDHKSSRKKHRSRHSSHVDDNEKETDEERDHKYSRSRHRSRHSSYSDEEEVHERDRKYSRKNHRSHRSSREDDGQEEEYERENRYSSIKRSSREGDEEEEGRDNRRSSKKHLSHRSSHHSRDRHKHRKRHSSSKDRVSRHRHKHDSPSDVEHKLRDRGDTNRKESAEKDDLEEGEISPKISDQSRGYVGNSASREASVDVSMSNQDGRAPSQPSDISDDLRAKIRAMLMSTM